MKFLVEKDGERLYIKAMVGQSKRMLRATDAEELIRAMTFLEKCAGMPEEQLNHVASCIEKTEEREFLEAAIGQFLAKGGKIQVIPRADGPKEKLSTTRIHDILAELGLEGPAEPMAALSA